MLSSNWMGRLLHDSDCRLTELVIPGTHHSGSYSIRSTIPFGRNIGCTQGISVHEQLCHGARYLDLRVAPHDDSFVIRHSFLRGAKIEDILQEACGFCQEHTDEVVIFELVPEFGRPFTDGQKQACLELCLSRLDKLLLKCAPNESSPTGGYPEILQTPFRQILANGPERVLLLLHHRFNNVLSSDAMQYYKGRYLQGSICLQNPWHNTNQRHELQERNLRCLAQECDEHPTRPRLVCSQLVATPQTGSARQILTLVGTGTRSLWPRALARKLYASKPASHNDDTMLAWFRRTLGQPVGNRSVADESNSLTTNQGNSQQGGSWNICSLDFIELCPELVDAMILANQSKPKQND